MENYFSESSTKTYVVGTQKNCLIETVLLSRDSSFEYPQHMFKLMDKKIITIVRLKKFPYLDLCQNRVILICYFDSIL